MNEIVESIYQPVIQQVFMPILIAIFVASFIKGLLLGMKLQDKSLLAGLSFIVVGKMIDPFLSGNLVLLSYGLYAMSLGVLIGYLPYWWLDWHKLFVELSMFRNK